MWSFDLFDLMLVGMFLIVILGVFLAIIFVLMLYDLFRQKVTSGVVVNKLYEEERTWTQLIPFWVDKVMILIPYVHYDDEDWVLVLENREGEKPICGNLYVNKETWDSVEIGDYYQAESGDETKDDIVKEKAK